MSSSQTWNAGDYARNARFVSDLGEPVLELLAPRPGERILDLGCGDGALTARLAASGAAVIGVDHAESMVAAACELGLDARVADATALPFDAEFDAVFSSAVLHWVKADPDAAIASVWRALRPGGRFVAEFGGHACVAAVVTALLAELARRGVADPASCIPWYFPTAEEYGARLEAAGFQVESIALIPRPTPLPSGMRAWLVTFASRFAAALPEPERSGFLDDVTERLRPVLCDYRGNWTADYTRVRLRALKL